MKDWRKRFEQIEEWRKSPRAIEINLRGSPFAASAKILKQLQVTMKPLLEDLLIFDVSELQDLDDLLLTESQKEYLRAFQPKG